MTLQDRDTGVVAKQAIKWSLLVILLLSVVELSHEREWPTLTSSFSFLTSWHIGLGIFICWSQYRKQSPPHAQQFSHSMWLVQMCLSALPVPSVNRQSMILMPLPKILAVLSVALPDKLSIQTSQHRPVFLYLLDFPCSLPPSHTFFFYRFVFSHIHFLLYAFHAVGCGRYTWSSQLQGK